MKILNDTDVSGELTVDGTSVSLEGHTHNDIYYTETETDNLLDEKFNKHNGFVTDFNDAVVTGYYIVEGTDIPNNPVPGVTLYGKLLVVAYDGDEITVRVQQKFFDVYHREFVRRKVGTDWDSWIQHWHEDNVYHNGQNLDDLLNGKSDTNHTHTLSEITDANDISVIEALSGTGFLVRTGEGTWAQRSIDQGLNVTVVNGSGVAGNPTISVANASEISRGVVYLATNSDVTTGTDTTKAVTPAGAANAFVKLTDYEDSDVLAKIKNVDGAASGLDADTVDGYHFNNFVLGIDYTGSNILSKLLPVDGHASGLDSDLVDGIDSSRIVYGSGDAKTNGRISISTSLPSGFNEIEGSSGIGAPTGTWYHVITNRHTNTDANYQMQIAGEFFDVNNFYYRIISNGSVGSWAKIWHSLNGGSGSGLDADTVDGAHYSLFRNVGCNVIRTSNEGVFGAGLQTTTFSGYLNNSGAQAYWDGGTALYATLTGWYLLTGAAQIAPTANTDNVGCGISVNGTLVAFNQQRRSSSTLAINVNCSCVYYMTAGQYIQLRPYAGNTFNSVYSANYSPVLGLIYLGA